MNRAFLRWAAVIGVFAFPWVVHAANVTVKIDKITQMGTSWKVEVSGTLSIDKGETYLGVVANFLNEDDKSKEPVTWVSLTPPKVGTDGSFSYYGVIPNGNWVATATMKYINTSGQQKDFPGGKGFKLPPE